MKVKFNFAAQLFQTMNSDGSNNLSLKYQRYTQSGCKDIWIINFKFVNQILFTETSYRNKKCYQ